MFEPRPVAFARVRSVVSWGSKYMSQTNLANDTLVAPLLRVELFQDLTPLQLSGIARRAERIVFREGDRITDAGGEADAAYLIVGGAAEWLRSADTSRESGPETSAGKEPIEIGSLIGEMAMFIDYVYGATIIASGPVKCLKLSRATMHALMLDDPSLAEHMTMKIARRLTRLADDLRAIDQDFGDSLPGFVTDPAAELPTDLAYDTPSLQPDATMAVH